MRPRVLRTYSEFWAGVQIFHLSNPYYVIASIHSSNTHALREAGKVEDSFEYYEANST
jgi:hypothetical protein